MPWPALKQIEEVSNGTESPKGSSPATAVPRPCVCDMEECFPPADSRGLEE